MWSGNYYSGEKIIDKYTQAFVIILYFTLGAFERTSYKTSLSYLIFQSVESDKILQLGAQFFDKVSPWDEITL